MSFLFIRVSTFNVIPPKVLASPIDSSTSRMVRVGAIDGGFSDSCRQSAMLSPTLLHNLCPRGRRQIVIRMSPYGTQNPGIPIARSIELARVASPFTIRRCYDPLFIDALHEHFGSSKRLVKCGDIIPLRINLDLALDPRRALRPGDFAGGVTHNRSDVPIYFVVRNVDYGSVTIQGHGQPFPSLSVGCFVDSNMTRIIQVGVERVRVPDIYDYYELGLVSFWSFLLCLNSHSQVIRGWHCQLCLMRLLSCRMLCHLKKQQAWVCGLQFLSRDRGERANSQLQCALPAIFRCIL